MELKEAFVNLRAAEDDLTRLEGEKKQADFEMEQFMATAKADVAKWEGECARIMRENGVIEDTIEGVVSNYKLFFGTPRRTVDIVDEDAVPDEFVKVERKPKKAEITKAFKDAVSLPNWLQWKDGESKFQWRPVKK